MQPDLYIPQAFIDDVKQYLPDHLTLESFIDFCKKPLRKSIRVNTLKISVEDFVKLADERNWQLTAIPWCEEGFWLTRSEHEERSVPLGNTDLHLAGCFYVQEASSMLPPFAMKQQLSQQPVTVLDMAAAPGSKTSQLAAYMNNDGVLVANEYSSSRLKVLAATLQKLGIYNTALSHFDGAIFGAYMENCFDHILLDAPCSGEGTVRKDPDALKNWSIESNQNIAATQKQLIESAFYALKPGGTLVYSTCTLTPLENQEVCQHLLETFPGSIEISPLNDLFQGAERSVTPEGYLHVWPQFYDSEGFFIARFYKQQHVKHPAPKTKKGRFPFEQFSGKQRDEFLAYLKKQFGIASLPGRILQREKELWLSPESLSYIEDKIKYSRIGIKLGVIHKNGVRLSHDFATCLGQLAAKNTISITNNELFSLFSGKNLEKNNISNSTGEILLTYSDSCVGIAKWQKNKIKNNLPRELVRNNPLIT